MQNNNAYGYSEYNNFNRFTNLDGIEAKIINHLVDSSSKHAENIWKLLKYNDLHALNKPNLTKEEKIELIYNDNGEMTSKRVFFQPFTDDAWQEQCCSLYIFVSDIRPIDHIRAQIGITIESAVHNKICTVVGDGDPILNPQANPNDSNSQGDIVVAYKNRATVLLKSILAELNGLYIDGIGYIQFNNRNGVYSKVEAPLYKNHRYCGHAITFSMALSGESGSSEEGY